MSQNKARPSFVARAARRMEKAVVDPIKRPLYLDVNRDYRRTIFLAGVERSGTTWLSELINYKHEYRYIFEPFWGQRVPESQIFRWQQYLRPESDNREMLKVAANILSGRIRNPWADKYHRRFVASQRVVKDIRTNLMLKWLHVNFPEMPLILMLRHPCAVTASLMRRKGRWGLDLQRDFLEQPLLVEDFLSPFVNEIERAQSDFEHYILRWCIQNYVPLRQFQPGEIHIIFYEDLCIEPEREIKRLFNYLDKPYNKLILEALNVPSPVSNRQSAIVSGGDIIRKWTKYISEEERDRAAEILAIFGMDALYDASPVPRSQNLEAWMADSAAKLA